MSDLNDDQLHQLCAALGWQGGTFWQVLEEVRQQRAAIIAVTRESHAATNGILALHIISGSSPADVGGPEPAGWKLVPVEPTIEMMTAVDDAYGNGGDFPDMWAAALAAAPLIRRSRSE